MTLMDIAERIKSMDIRGAGKIAREAAAALRDHAASLPKTDLPSFLTEMKKAEQILLATRPTAVSLPNAVRITLRGIAGAETEDDARLMVQNQADAFIQSSNAALNKIAEITAARIRDGDTVMTHCNSSAALAGIIRAKEQGKDITVFATEVRPWNQGRITIKTLNDHAIPTNFIVDSAVRTFMPEVDLVIVGADAVTVNGAVVNKIGTSQIALSAKEARKNLIVAAETYKFAPQTIFGNFIEIEDRSSSEVLPDDILRTLPYVKVRNPVFDVTPAEYIDLIATEVGAVPPQLAYYIMKDHLGWNPEEI
ncbi:MAG TPA: ribose 1,5-bisphosphate isomerase [Methanocorpusculum sp.]|nr:ribose 1,5-bisphosphate isomerase [Methanocorpusculum sp.]HJJ40103.1 ribose 1,5-bisphosphate isomerase [Methanocorpusculum sp.]HJJ49014.1 ribose 1,5-bisphosphate isomerase [Methanocorpusculum sp.]HJJ57258.1 ribose 1,5-bisphosphate isomerase [Methanocorpusculum sp.]